MNSNNDLLFGAIEAGGTKMLCAILDKDAKIIKEISVPTTTPEETIKPILSFFSSHKITSLGIGTFGPIDLHQNSPNFGSILNTPKLAWKNFNYIKNATKPMLCPTILTPSVTCVPEAYTPMDLSSQCVFNR